MFITPYLGNQGVVILPPEVRLETCCIGTCAKCKLFLQNVSPKWMESRVVIQKLTCNGQNWDMMTTPSVLSLTPPRAIEPLSVYEIDIVFIPPTEGTWESMLQFFFRDLSLISSHVASDSPSIDWCSYPTIRVTAKAKKPNLSASPESIIDFGILPEESLSMIHIKLSNNEDCSLPVHLIMEGVRTMIFFKIIFVGA